MSQVEQDERLARKLEARYNSSYTGFGSPVDGDPPMPRARRETGLKPNELYDGKEHSFIDGKTRSIVQYPTADPCNVDDLPVIKQNLTKGFQDTKNTINKWLKDFQKRLDGDDSDDGLTQPGGSSSQRQDFGPSTSNQVHGIRRQAEANRRSGG